jgi:hypothetical protein
MIRKARAEQIVREPRHRDRFDYIFVGSWDAHPKADARVQVATLVFSKPVDGHLDKRSLRRHGRS